MCNFNYECDDHLIDIHVAALERNNQYDLNTKMSALSEDEDDELTRDLESLNEILQVGKSAELPCKFCVLGKWRPAT